MTKSRAIAALSIPVLLAAVFAGNLVGPVIVLAWCASTRTPWSRIGIATWPHWVRESMLAVLCGVLLKVALKTVILPPLGVPAVAMIYSGTEQWFAGLLWR